MKLKQIGRILFHTLGVGTVGASSIFVFYMFLRIQFHGYAKFIENNLAVRYTEIGIFCFGLVYFSYLFYTAPRKVWH